MIGTLEMASGIRTQGSPWTAKLILVDEAAQATELMTMIPLQLANAYTHVVLMGDHKQLAPRVLSISAAWEGLGTTMFERLLEEPGLDFCMLDT